MRRAGSCFIYPSRIGEGIKLKLVEKIKGLDILNFLEQYSWIPEVQYTVTNLSNHPELLPQIEQAIKFWKENVMIRKDKTDYQMVLYKAELLVAYFEKSEDRIDRVKEPERNYIGYNELHLSTYKEFYKGLLCIQTDPKKAHNIFDNLVRRYSGYPSFALNRMVAKINLAQNEDDPRLYREALEEWMEFQKKVDDNTIIFLEPELSQSIMTVLNKIGDYQQLDTTYENLDLPNRMQPAVLEIMVQSLIDQKKISEALQLANAAKTYHQFGDIKDIQFVADLEDKINKIDNLEELRSHYHRIFTSEPKRLIRIFPEDLNGRVDLNQFIVKEIVLAVDKLLEKIKSIEEIKSEDKYNDIIELALDARINPWGWHVAAQSRGAFSGTGGKQPGERDLPIMSKNKQVLMVCEAFIYRGITTASSHLTKIFNYYHKRNVLTVLVYDTWQTSKDFEKNWKEYTEEIIPATNFPTGFELAGSVKDVCKSFEFDKSAIKIGASEHGDGTTLYHIFVNINYRVR